MDCFINSQEENALIRLMEVNRLTTSQAKQIVDLWKHWEKHHGPRWLVAHLKGYYHSLLNPKGECKFGRRSDGSWKGPMRPIQRMTEDGTRRSKIRACRLLRLCGRWEAKRVTIDDYAAHTESLRLPGPSDTLVDWGDPLSVSPEDRWLADHSYKDFDKVYPLSNTKAPVGNGATLVESEALPIDHINGLIKDAPELTLRHSRLLKKVVKLPDDWLFRSAYDYQTVDVGGTGYIDLGSLQESPQIVGHLSGLTKDRALKVRFIANPNRALQLALSRLKNTLEEYLRVFPESCVHDQEKGVRWIQKKLSQSSLIWSIDLSKATDNFPLRLQSDLLYTLFPKLKADIDLWVDVCRASWRPSCFPKGKRAEFLAKFEKGQPLGTAPSFFAFTVAHIHLIRDCGGNAANFRVIGDDVVISDRKIAEAYLKRLAALGVEVSATKSLMGQNVAEFAGRVVDRHGPWRLYKASGLDVKSDPCGYVRQYGMAGLRLIPKRVRRQVKKFCQLPVFGVEPFTAPSVLDNVPSELIYEAYKDKPRLYEPRRSPVLGLPSVRPLDILEVGDPELGTSLLEYGNDNHPTLVEHVNKNLVEGNTSSALLQWESSLSWNSPPGTLSDSVDKEFDNKKPISFVNKLCQLLFPQ